MSTEPSELEHVQVSQDPPKRDSKRFNKNDRDSKRVKRERQEKVYKVTYVCREYSVTT